MVGEESPLCDSCQQPMKLAWTTWDNGLKISNSYRCYDCNKVNVLFINRGESNENKNI